MNRKRVALLASISLLSGSLAIAQSSYWLHFKVETAGAETEQVKLNVPMALVEAVLPIIEENETVRGKIHVSDLPMTVAQMREIWQTLKSEGDFELASIQDGSTNLRVFQEGGYLYVRSNEEAQEQIEVNIPATVVDALLSGDGDELDLMAAARALVQTDAGQLVLIRDGDETVRVWVDTSSASE